MVNRKVVEYACRAGLALNCEITRRSRFDRKNYFYPDLPKAYQVSQLYLPIARNGRVSIATAAGEKVVRIHELHMEEDAGKLVHDPWLDQTRADYNRCGVPLVEIVTEPDFRSAEEVIAYLEKLKSILEYLGISDCKMQEGSLRCDVNLSVRPAGSRELGTRTEMKNLNSFKAIARAIDYDAQRQVELIEEGRRVVQETRRWDDAKGKSYVMRSKEDAQDYRYFPDPDLLTFEVSEAHVQELKDSIPELPVAKALRYVKEYGLLPVDAELLASNRARSEVFDACVALGNCDKKLICNWMIGDIAKILNERRIEITDTALTKENLTEMIALIEKGTISNTAAKTVLDVIIETDVPPAKVVEEKGLAQISDSGALGKIVDDVLANNPKAVADYKGGKTNVAGFLVGQCMKASRGQGNPGVLREMLLSAIEKL